MVKSVYQSGRFRSGYTLLEIILAVTIILIISGLAASPLIHSWNDVRVGEEAEKVRALAAGTRMESLDSDVVWYFCYEPGGTHFLRVPGIEAGSSASNLNGKRSGFLPAGMSFSTSSGSGQVLKPEQLSGLANAGELASVGWSSPVEFFPDGTATNASFEVLDVRGSSRRIHIRDVTGAVTVTRRGQSSP